MQREVEVAAVHPDGPAGIALRNFRRRALRQAALLMVVGHALLTILFVATDRMSLVAIGTMLTAVVVHGFAAAGVGRWWEPGDRVSLGYVVFVMGLVCVGVSDAAAPTTDGAWFTLVPVGLGSLMFGGRRLAALLVFCALALVGAFAVGPGLDPVVLPPRLAALAVFSLAIRSVSHRVELALAEADAARAELARQVEAERAVNDRLRELDELKDDFVSTASHELRTPLSVVLGLSETLTGRWAALEEAQRLDLATRIESHARGLQGIVATLLDTAKLQRGGLDVRVEPVGVQALVGGAVHRLASPLREHGVEVRIEVPPGTHALGDPALLERVLDNLLANAARHTPTGTRVMVTAAMDGASVRISVADEGPGIAEEEVSRIGERFYRAGDRDTRTRDGVGLGLALVREVLAALDTELEITTAVGVGTSFGFLLPTAPVVPSVVPERLEQVDQFAE